MVLPVYLFIYLLTTWANGALVELLYSIILPVLLPTRKQEFSFHMGELLHCVVSFVRQHTERAQGETSQMRQFCLSQCTVFYNLFTLYDKESFTAHTFLYPFSTRRGQRSESNTPVETNTSGDLPITDD